MTNGFYRIYSFLAGFGNTKAWIEEADANDDGAITINEFRTLIDDNWNTDTLGNVPENDLINNFFRRFDSNKSGANKDRIQTKNGSVSNLYAWSSSEYNNQEMLDNIEKFVNINEVLKSSSGTITTLMNNVFSGITCSQAKIDWESAIKNILSNKLSALDIKEINTDKIEELLDSDDEIKSINVNYAALGYIENLSGNYSQYVEHGYDINNDADLMNIINSIPNTSTTEQITSAIDNYLNGKEADGETDSEPITQGQKDLAGAVLRKNLLDSLKNDNQNYEQYKDAYTRVVDKYVDSLKETATKMSDIKDKTLNDFKQDQIYRELENEIVLQQKFDATKTALSDVTIETLVNATDFGTSYETFKTLAQNANILSDITDEVIMEAIENGEITFAEGSTTPNNINTWLRNYIIENIDKLFSNGYSDIVDGSDEGDSTDEEINAVHSKRLELINSLNDNDVKLAQMKKAAIDYCDWRAAKGTANRAAIRDVFGSSDYTTAINSLTSVNDLSTKLTNLKTACDAIEEDDGAIDPNLAGFEGSINSTYNLNLSGKEKIHLPDTMTYNGEEISTDRITYTVSCNGVDIVYDNSKKTMTINPTTFGTFKASITMCIDGKAIKTKESTIIITNQIVASDLANNVTDWSGTKPDGVKAHLTKDGTSGKDISLSHFKDLYTNNSIICLFYKQDNDDYNWGADGKKTVRTRLEALGSYVGDTLLAANPILNQERLTQAINNVVDSYILKGSGNNGCSNSYKTNNNGNTENNGYDYINEHKDLEAVIHVKDEDGNDSNYYGITFATFVNAIITEYNRLMGLSS